MIIKETININGNEFVRTYSDKMVFIYGGDPEANYEEAIDPADSGRTYIETDIPIESEGFE